LYEKYHSRGNKPPIDEWIDCMKKMGRSQKDIDEAIKYHVQCKKNSHIEQAKLDAIFAKYKIKPLKKKVLKPVKKTVTNYKYE
jgi:hypothetical protein